MQISQSSSSAAVYALQRLFSSGQTAETGNFPAEKMPGRQSLPGAEPRPANAGGGGQPQMSGDTMSEMVSMQFGPPPTAESVADDLISSFDSDEDGSLSASEIETALASAGTSTDVASLLADMDTDGDSLLSATELTTAIQSDMDSHATRGSGGPPPGGPPPGGPSGPGQASADDIALSILETLDTDDEEGLSLSEVSTALGVEEDDSDVAGAFAALDADSDGNLSASELALAIQEAAAQRQAAYARSAALAV